MFESAVAAWWRSIGGRGRYQIRLFGWQDLVTGKPVMFTGSALVTYSATAATVPPRSAQVTTQCQRERFFSAPPPRPHQIRRAAESGMSLAEVAQVLDGTGLTLVT